MTEKPFRILPEVNAENEHFWRGGAKGRLQLLRCCGCGYWIHPPSPRCPLCLATDVGPRAVSGRATLLTFTVNHQPWIPGFPPPYVVAIVELVEQEGLRLTTNIVGCNPDEVAIGMRLRVVFEEHDGIWLPLFAPAEH